MKNLLKLSLIAGFFIAAGSASAQNSDATTNSTAKIFAGKGQYKTWSLGLNAGVLAPRVLTGGSEDFTNWDVNLGYGLSLRKQVSHSFGIELGVSRGKLSGNNEDATGGAQNGRRSFETELGYAANIMGVINVATVDFLKRENNINFLVKAGYGVAAYAPSITTATGTVIDYKDHVGENGDAKYIKEQFIPVGVGVKFKVSESLNFDLGYNMNFIDGDNMDATYATGQDKWSYTYAGIEFSLGSAAKPNLDWVNPLALMYDELKDPSMRQELEALKARVNTTETAVTALGKDSDGDGVSDKFDKCPNTMAGVKVDGSGCPLDVDGDGVSDSEDKCPLEKGTKANNGCPEVAKTPVKEVVVLTEEEKKIVQEVFDNLEFTTGKAVIRPTSFPSLNKLATLLITKPNYNLKISGHTDNVGSAKANLTLSRNRANAVKTYLVKLGVPKGKIQAAGYGKTQPIADNTTEEGRQKNRRVEFNIY